MRSLMLTCCGLCVLAVMVADSHAGKGGNGGGKPPPDEPPADPAIAYVERVKSTMKLGVMNADGSNKTELLSANLIMGVSWSPENSQLAFTSDTNGTGLYVIDVDGTGLTKLVSTLGGGLVDWSPAAAPDGEEKIAFAAPPTSGSRPDIFVINADGTGAVVNLTNTANDGEYTPTWSPDATSLATDIIIGSGNPSEIVLYDIGTDSGGSLEITDAIFLTQDADVPGGPLNDYGVKKPSFAKTQGLIVVYVNYKTDHMPDLWVIDPTDPANPVQITDTEDSQEGPANWSEDDSEFVFWAGDRKTKGKGAFANPGIYVADSDGSGGRTRILSNANSSAAWRR